MYPLKTSLFTGRYYYLNFAILIMTFNQYCNRASPDFGRGCALLYLLIKQYIH